MQPGPYTHGWHPAAGYPPYAHYPGMGPHSYPHAVAAQPAAAAAAAGRPPGTASDAPWPAGGTPAPGTPGFWPPAFPGYGHLPYGYPPGAAWQMAMQHGAGRPGMPMQAAGWEGVRQVQQGVKAEPGTEQRCDQEAASSHMKSSGASQ